MDMKAHGIPMVYAWSSRQTMEKSLQFFKAFIKVSLNINSIYFILRNYIYLYHSHVLKEILRLFCLFSSFESGVFVPMKK